MKQLPLLVSELSLNQLKRLLSSLLMVVVMVGGLGLGAVVYGQEAAESASPNLNQEIATVTATYRGQIQTYLNDERQFVIAKEQYVQLKTLTSLETAVVATGKVYQSRAEVVGTYLEYVRLQVLNTPAITTAQREQAVQELESAAQLVRQHQQALPGRTDRVGMAESAAEFSELLPAVEQASYYGLSLVAIGQLQATYDEAVVILEEMAAQPASEDPFIQAKRERAIQEIAGTLVGIKDRLAKVNENLDKNRDKGSRSTLNSVTTGLGPVYAQLSQVLAYLREINRF